MHRNRTGEIICKVKRKASVFSFVNFVDRFLCRKFEDFAYQTPITSVEQNCNSSLNLIIAFVVTKYREAHMEQYYL